MSIEKANLALLIDALNKLGKVGDPNGQGSVFAYLKRLEGFVDALEAQLGTSADPAGSVTTVHGKIADLRSLIVDTLMGSRIGVSTDGTSVASLFGKLALLQYGLNTDLIGNRIGSTGDAPNGTGTIMARLANLSTKVGTVGGYYRVSDTVLESDATVRSGGAYVGLSGQLVYVFFPKFTGEVKVKAEVNSQNANYTTYISAAMQKVLASAVDTSAVNSTTPIGTIFNVQNSVIMIASMNVKVAAFTPVSMIIGVTAGVPVFLIMNSTDGSGGYVTTQCRNISICGTEVRY